MSGIRVLNVDLGKETAIIYDMKMKPLSIGTDEFYAFLTSKKIKELSVDLKSDWELNLFNLKKRDNDKWVASKDDIEESFEIGRSQEITITKLLEIDAFFKKCTK